MVKAAIGESIDNETLGGATTHCEISGVTDYKAENDSAALDKIKSIVDKIGDFDKAGYSRTEANAPKENPQDIYGILPKSRSEQYDMKEIIKRLVDDSEFEEYKEGYGKTILTGYARIDGWAVGIVANHRKVVKNKKGEMQFGGVIYSDSADKATRFIANCNQKKIPLVFLQDVTGFMVGSKSEHGGIIKDGAKMVNAVSNSVVPKFTIVIGNSYGAGNYAMCGKAYDPRLIAAWPSAELAVMSGNSAAKVLMQIEKASLKKKGEEIDEKKDRTVLVNTYDYLGNPVREYQLETDVNHHLLSAVSSSINNRSQVITGLYSIQLGTYPSGFYVNHVDRMGKQTMTYHNFGEFETFLDHRGEKRANKMKRKAIQAKNSNRAWRYKTKALFREIVEEDGKLVVMGEFYKPWTTSTNRYSRVNDDLGPLTTTFNPYTNASYINDQYDIRGNTFSSDLDYTHAFSLVLDENGEIQCHRLR